MDQYILDMQAEYKILAKRADRKLRDLEARAAKEHDMEYLRYAYARAMRDIKSHGGRSRFDIKPSSDPEELRAMLADARRFDESETSLYMGFKRIQKSRLKKFNDSLGTNFTQEEFTKIMELGAFDLLTTSGAAIFGYRVAVRILSVLVKNKKNIVNRTRRMTGQQMLKILSKYKFEEDPELYEIVQGVIKGIL